MQGVEGDREPEPRWELEDDHITGADTRLPELGGTVPDGGTELAGAISDGATCERAREAGVDIRDALARHRSGDAVVALGDGIETGPTHTNVNDLFAIAIGEAD